MPADVVEVGGATKETKEKKSTSDEIRSSSEQLPSESGAQSSVNSSEGASTPSSGSATNKDPLVEIKQTAESLAQFIVLTLLEQNDGKTKNKVEAAMLRCVRSMMQKHHIIFKAMMKRLDINKETGYLTFVGTANELFEGESRVITWERIIALYAFGGQLALHCKEKNMEDYAITIGSYMGRYAAEVLSPFVVKEGGWEKFCDKYQTEEDVENKAWLFLTWIAVGLGIATAATFLTSH